jgi:type IV pilus biogenesis protein CpaD/CtpE
MSRLAPAGTLLSVTLILAGCAARQPRPAARAPDATPQGPVIVRLVGQHQTVTVTSSPDGPLYTAQTSDGRTIVANATLAELRRDNPEVYRSIEPALAADARVDGGAARPARATQSPSGKSEVVTDRLMLDSAR